jgi:hypothetical protein
MRTTLDIDDEILEAAKEIARRTRSTAGRVLSELARRALTQTVGTPAVREQKGSYGFRPIPAAKVVSNSGVNRLRDDEAI